MVYIYKKLFVFYYNKQGMHYVPWMEKRTPRHPIMGSFFFCSLSLFLVDAAKTLTRPVERELLTRRTRRADWSNAQ